MAADGDPDASATEAERLNTYPKPHGAVRCPVNDIPFQNVPHPPLLNPQTAGTLQPYKETFARRLYRACVEQGYRCLTDPSTEPETLARIFRLPLTMVTRQYIVAHFEFFLRYGSHGSLGELDIPFISIGGAGTHFKHDQRSYISDGSAPESGVTELGADQIGHEMQGEWFDCYDVEGYLKSARVVPARRLSRGRGVVDESLLIECKYRGFLGVVTS